MDPSLVCEVFWAFPLGLMIPGLFLPFIICPQTGSAVEVSLVSIADTSHRHVESRCDPQRPGAVFGLLWKPSRTVGSYRAVLQEGQPAVFVCPPSPGAWQARPWGTTALQALPVHMHSRAQLPARNVQCDSFHGVPSFLTRAGRFSLAWVVFLN